MSEEQLERLHELVHAAQAVIDRPWEPGETARPLTFFTDHLDADGWQLAWELVAELRELHADLFGSFSEEGLLLAALDCVLATDAPASVQEIAGALEEIAAEQSGSWLIAVPLANVALDRTWAPVGATAALRRAWDFDRDPGSDRDFGPGDSEAEFSVFHHLGDRLSPPTRFLSLENGAHLDTKRTVSLLSVERGARLIAVEAARAKAHYAVASWSVLSPPAQRHMLPDVSVWSPQPDLHESPQHKRLEQGTWPAHERRHGGELRHFAPYELPGDEVLAAPYEAFAQLQRRSAQALLSATAALYDAGRGSRSHLTRRIRDVRIAIDCLCEREPGSGGALARWQRLAARFEVWEQVAQARSYTPERIVDLQQRLANARNIGTHGADAVLIDLGWTGGDRPIRQGQRAPATDLALTALLRDLGPMLFAVGEALRAVWAHMRSAEFDDHAFEELFSA